MKITNTDIIFSFNKASIGNPDIPPWTLKCKGQTYYCWHITSDAPWNTKETPDNPHTKGSIKFKNATLEIDDSKQAIISKETK